jgi:hypothetical protein
MMPMAAGCSETDPRGVAFALQRELKDSDGVCEVKKLLK